VNFRRWIVFTFLIHVLVVVVDKGGGLVLYLLTASHKEEHGSSGIAAAVPFILMAIANLGLATSLVFLVRRGKHSPQVAFETSLAVALTWGSIVGGGAAVLMLVVLPAFRPEWSLDPWLVVPVCASVPLLLVASYANSTQLATERIRDYGVVHLVTSLAFLPAFFGVFFAAGASVEGGDVPFAVAWGRLGSTLLVVALTLWLVRGCVRLRARVDRQYLGDALRFGWKANITSTLGYLNQRSGMVVLAAVALEAALSGGAEEDAAKEHAKVQVAYLSMALTWAELVWHFPEAMRDLFFSKVAGSTHGEARALTPTLSRLGLLLAIVGAVATLLLIDPVMGTLTHVAKGDAAIWYGGLGVDGAKLHSGWSDGVGAALLALSFGTVPYTVSKVLQADLAARGHLQTCVNAQVLTFVVMMVLYVLWIPGHGATGAAAATSVAYVAGTVLTLVAYTRQTGASVWSCLFVRASDLRYIREIFAAIVAKLRSKRR
jgi:O-antigen/teichoic acid export membrane protein